MSEFLTLTEYYSGAKFAVRKENVDEVSEISCVHQVNKEQGFNSVEVKMKNGETYSPLEESFDKIMKELNS